MNEAWNESAGGWSDEAATTLPGGLLTEAFYRWEERGRGWLLWDSPVAVEPPFSPFRPANSATGSIEDDARSPTLLGGLIEKAGNYFRRSPDPVCERYGSHAAEQLPLPVPYTGEGEPVVELQLSLPEKLKVTPGLAEQLILSLSSCRSPLSFEVVGLADSVRVQVACREVDRGTVLGQLRAHFPDAAVIEQSQWLDGHWRGAGSLPSVVVDFGLAREFMLPLSVSATFDADPMTGVIGALSGLREGEVGVFQILFQAARHPWPESVMRAVTDGEGKPFFADAPEMLPRAREKVSRPLLAAVVRAAARGQSLRRAWRVVRGLGASLARLSSPVGNELIALANDGYEEATHSRCVASRLTYRSGMLLNSEELAALAHPPSASVRSEKLKRDARRTKAAPPLTAGHELTLGKNTHHGKTRMVTLSPDQRTKHAHVIGVSGSGKSTLLLSMIRQDLENGHGLCVLDPHGDLVDQVIDFVPDRRLDDVILFDPADEAFPVGFNILSAHSELEKNLLASDLVAAFRRLSTSWGDQMNSVLANAILAFLESAEGGTLADLRRFLIDRAYRAEFLRTVADPDVVYYWEEEFPLLAGRPQAPLLTRLDTFLRLKLIRNIVAQRENRLDIRRIMDGRRVLLARLSQGAVGEENAHLLGTLLVSKFHQTALSRQEVGESERPPFFLYIDEFQNFVTPSMAAILSGARKYGLGLTLAHQEFRQLWGQDKDVASAVISNPYTRICFRLGDFDAQRLARGFSSFEAEHLQNLGVGEAVARVERNEYDFNLKTFLLPEVDAEVARRRRETILRLSRERYGTRREDVEAELLAKRPAVSVNRPAQPAARRAAKKSTPLTNGAQATAREDDQSPATPPPSNPPVFMPNGGTKPANSKDLTLGRGGRQHKYLQGLIKRMAEAKGYRVTVEHQVLGGAGSVDVALEKEGQRMACEISVTSTDKYELNNIQKCLAAGYEPVVFISSDKRTLSKVRGLVEETLSAEGKDKVMYFQPEEFLAYLETLEAAGTNRSKTVKGYRVKVKYKAVEGEEQKARKQAISRVLMQALRRMKKPE